MKKINKLNFKQLPWQPEKKYSLSFENTPQNNFLWKGILQISWFGKKSERESRLTLENKCIQIMFLHIFNHYFTNIELKKFYS